MDPKNIEIYDNVVDEKTLYILKEIITHKKNNNEGLQQKNSSYTLRNMLIDRTKPIECSVCLFLHRLLLELGDNTKYIEYWIHIDNTGIGFHRDCDDELLSETNKLILPEKAHILYLDNDVYCPTMILNNDTDNNTDNNTKNNTKNNMIMCPNISGRLTRFDGNLYHSVGIPEINFNNKFKKMNRNVILFNTWNEENYKLSTFPNNKNNFCYSNTYEMKCNPFLNWKNIDPIINNSEMYDYKLLFKFLRKTDSRKIENYTSCFNEQQIENGYFGFCMSSEIIDHYNKREICPLLIKVMIDN